MRFDKRIDIEERANTVSTGGTPKKTPWDIIRNCAANVFVSSTGAEETDEGVLPYQKVEFTIRYSGLVNYKCRVVYKEQHYNIDALETIGRDHYLKITSIVFPGDLTNG